MTGCTVVDMAPACVNLVNLIAGDANKLTVALTSNGEPWDLTGAVINAQARADLSDEVPTFVAESTVADPLSGVIVLFWPGDSIRELLVSLGVFGWTGVWDMEVTLAGETYPKTVISGTFSAKMDVSR